MLNSALADTLAASEQSTGSTGSDRVGRVLDHVPLALLNSALCRLPILHHGLCITLPIALVRMHQLGLQLSAQKLLMVYLCIVSLKTQSTSLLKISTRAHLGPVDSSRRSLTLPCLIQANRSMGRICHIWSNPRSMILSFSERLMILLDASVR